MKHLYLIVGLILGLTVAVFALQNTDSIQIRFLWWQAQGPVAAITLISAVAGALVVLLFALPGWLSARWRIRGLERRLEGRLPETLRPENRKE
jgi:uncharacterized integral membrane protein